MVSHMIVSLWEEQKQIFFYEKETKSKWVFGQTCTPQRRKNFRFEGNIQHLKKISCPIAKFNMGDQADFQHFKGILPKRFASKMKASNFKKLKKLG